MAVIGPTFSSELQAAGLLGLPFSWSKNGLGDLSNLTQQQKDAVAAVLAAHNPNTGGPVQISTDLLQARIDFEGLWDTYVNFMFGANVRRNAFVKTMMIGRVDINSAPMRASLVGAGFTQAQIDRVLAPPPPPIFPTG